MKIRTAKEMGALIRGARKQAGWDQQQLADRIGAGRLWVSQIENGKSSARLDLVLRALHVLGLDLVSEARTTPAPGSSADRVRRLILDDHD